MGSSVDKTTRELVVGYTMKNVSLLLVFIASTSVFIEINALEFKNEEEMPIQDFKMLEQFQNYPEWMERLNEELNMIYNKPTYKMPYSRQLRSGASPTSASNVKNVYDLWRNRRNFKNKHIFRVGKKSDIWRLN